MELRQNRLHVSRGMLYPLLPGTPQIGLDVTQIKNIVNPLPAGFPRNRSPLKGNPPFRGTRGPHKMYILRGAPFGARAQATALRLLRGAANYATCYAPASRRDGALLAYDTSSPRHSLRRRRTCKSGCAAVQVLVGRLQLRKSSRHAQARAAVNVRRRCYSPTAKSSTRLKSAYL